ncbi:MAG: two-component system response regulator [Candidatus Omnitrophota bacterium]|nr:MAG: two-component system response regulator [Candidatus Omnitrophota bacterium]RKY36420.1 MAG: two-component system response regulator [Candidatus Omnitrophota bacterium]RKY45763.1 MAG: two-component system response regulator [Candidatus Omnitrophota bacterium]HDN86033.1 response regulator [Candidatus Omnitrophota bacterium]
MPAKILIVDDALFMRKMLGDILKKEGFEICGEAENGKEAIEKYKELKPDLVTMDIVMPRMEEIDGIGAVKEIIRIDPNAKIVMVSAMGQHALVVEAIQAGAKDFIVKPFQPSRVVEAIRRVLGE